MSILINNMTMPERCDDCKMRHLGLARCQITGKSTSHHPTGKPMDQKKRPAWCPLIEIQPPHGRLIDATELELRMYHDAFETDTEMKVWDGDGWIRYRLFNDALDEAPTVIEADWVLDMAKRRMKKA